MATELTGVETTQVAGFAKPATLWTASVWNVTVWVAALGYFVDMYDLSLFGIVRVASLKDLGIMDPKDLLTFGAMLVNWQMGGMLLGGILWGILGDKRGRLSVLFGSILLYSLANIGNAFVHDIRMYALFRFVAGLGLAGELGAAITLVAEVMPKEIRGYGTTIVATLGLCGSAAAALVGDLFTWKTAYVVGGIMGLLLLVTRFNILESGMFDSVQKSHSKIRRGDLGLLLSMKRLPRYLRCIFIGIPIWFVTGVLMTFSPEFAKHLGVTGPVTAGHAILCVSLGLAAGDLASGLLSQWLKSRRKAVGAFLGGLLFFAGIYLGVPGMSPAFFYANCFILGCFAGYWAVFVTIASEQFGTNLRATVTTTVPNFVRGAVVPINLAFTALIAHHAVIPSAIAVGAVCFSLGIISLVWLPETYGKDLNYIES